MLKIIGAVNLVLLAVAMSLTVQIVVARIPRASLTRRGWATLVLYLIVLAGNAVIYFSLR